MIEQNRVIVLAYMNLLTKTIWFDKKNLTMIYFVKNINSDLFDYNWHKSVQKFWDIE